jgi:hypothetical protein
MLVASPGFILGPSLLFQCHYLQKAAFSQGFFWQGISLLAAIMMMNTKARSSSP